jgi:predicted Zn-dependent peptidase
VEAVEVVAGELRRLLEEPGTAEELERAKENVKARIVLGLESSAARMNRLGSSILFGLPLLEPEELMERIDAVTLDDLAALAAELWAPGRLSAAGIGPDEDAFRSALEVLERSGGERSETG